MSDGVQTTEELEPEEIISFLGLSQEKQIIKKTLRYIRCIATTLLRGNNPPFDKKDNTSSTVVMADKENSINTDETQLDPPNEN